MPRKQTQQALDARIPRVPVGPQAVEWRSAGRSMSAFESVAMSRACSSIARICLACIESAGDLANCSLKLWPFRRQSLDQRCKRRKLPLGIAAVVGLTDPVGHRHPSASRIGPDRRGDKCFEQLRPADAFRPQAGDRSRSKPRATLSARSELTAAAQIKRSPEFSTINLASARGAVRAAAFAQRVRRLLPNRHVRIIAQPQARALKRRRTR